ncbi:alpha/beta hydrolase [Maricaulis sp. CAU 1757]
MRSLALIAALTLAACQTTPPVPADPHAASRPITWSDLLERPRETADHRVQYGPGEQEFGELWLPTGPGPHPVVVMIHGGCWLSQVPGTILQDYLAADLRNRDIAVWNVEYARLGHADGGWPGTFDDVRTGVTHLGTLAAAHDLDLDRLAYLGHSAGGHLAVWAAHDRVLEPDAVISLAGILDLADYRDNGPGRCGEPDTVSRLIGDADLATLSPAAMPPLAVRQILFSGALDPIVPPDFGDRYSTLAGARGDRVEHHVIDGAGHFELIDPTTPAWTEIRRALEQALEMPQAE